MSILKTYIVPHPPIIIPEIGRGEERKIKDTLNAYRKISKEIKELEPDTIIISSPHAQTYMDYFHISPRDKAHGDFSQFGIREVKMDVKYDKKLVKDIEIEAWKKNISAGTKGERNRALDHGVMVPLYFIHEEYQDFKVIRLSPSGLSPLDHYKYGKLIEGVIPEDKKVIWIASGDLSHKLKKDGPYGLAEEGPVFDQEIVEIVKEGDLMKLMDLSPKLCMNAAECGLSSFTMMSGLLDEYEYESNFHSYEGTFGVGYLIASFTPIRKITSRVIEYEKKIQEKMDEKRKLDDPYLTLARESLEYYTKTKTKLPVPPGLPKEMTKRKAGTFVSLHIRDRLRGCVGTTGPTTSSVANEIINNAIAAGYHDYRFSQITEKELPLLSYKVDVLMPSEPIKSMDQLDVVKYGVIVRSGIKTGLLLPNLEGINSVEQQVSIAKQKAGIPVHEDCELHRFEVIRHE